MKSALIIASVLLVGVALEVAARNVNDNQNQRENNNQWTRLQQGDSTDESVESNLNEYQNNNKFNNVRSNHGSESMFADRQVNQNDDTYFGSSQELGLQQQRKSQHQLNAASYPEGLAKIMVEKIAAIQKIAVDYNIAETADSLNAALPVNSNSVKFAKHNFVSFTNSTMKNLENGDLEYMYLNPERDTMFAQYQFNEIKTVGSFKSNIPHAHSGHYTVILNNVLSNLSTGFHDNKHAVIKAAKFQNADVNVITHDGSETQVFTPAMEQKYLGVLANTVSNEVMKSANKGALVQIKNEIRKPIVSQMNTARKNTNKLFDLRWQEDQVTMEMANIGFMNSEVLVHATEHLLNSVSFQRKSQDSYRMRYDFAIKNMGWTSPLNIVSANMRTTTDPIQFTIDDIIVKVFIDKSGRDQQQQLYGKAYTNVEVRGLHYNLKNVKSDLVPYFENDLQRFMEHSLGSYLQDSLVQELINSSRQY
ncbi:uncharacterized protein LOC132949059 [Metopolophium dirhodum]|uniref:uncharacterized protein LOC132949059 n=1 Tax=Metopolophium dirhodum TaxID=44670 RepID=UPI0029902676|nr:uncharacterized protein LOC132949059 [Metopolophium dirhodum]